MCAQAALSRRNSRSGVFSLDAAVGAISLLLAAYALAALPLERQYALSAQSESEGHSLLALEAADFFVKEGAVWKNQTPGIFGSGYSRHHQIDPDWADSVSLGGIATHANLSYLSLSISGQEISYGTPLPALSCSTRLALLDGQITPLRVCVS